MNVGSLAPCRPFAPRAPYEIGEPVRRIEVIPTRHPVVAPEPKTPLPARKPRKIPVREKDPA
jgi:hypothetical protein